MSSTGPLGERRIQPAGASSWEMTAGATRNSRTTPTPARTRGWWRIPMRLTATPLKSARCGTNRAGTRRRDYRPWGTSASCTDESRLAFGSRTERDFGLPSGCWGPGFPAWDGPHAGRSTSWKYPVTPRADCTAPFTARDSSATMESPIYETFPKERCSHRAITSMQSNGPTKASHGWSMAFLTRPRVPPIFRPPGGGFSTGTRSS